MSWRRPLKTSSQDVRLRWWRFLKKKTKDIFKTSLRHLHQDECLLRSKEKLCNELGLECRRYRWWMQRFGLFHKFSNLHLPKYLYDIILPLIRFYKTRNNKNISSFNCRTGYFMKSFVPNVINEWNKLDIKITNIKSHNTFKSFLLNFIRPLHCDTLEFTILLDCTY